MATIQNRKTVTSSAPIQLKDNNNNTLHVETYNRKDNITSGDDLSDLQTGGTIELEKEQVLLTPDATVLIFGPASAGKTTLLARIVNNKFQDEYSPTQFDHKTLKFHKKDGYDENCTLTFYDVAGQEDYQFFYRSFIDLCNIVFLCFPVGDRELLRTVESNYMPVLNFLADRSPPLIYLVGTKSDLTPHYSEEDMAEYRYAVQALLKAKKYPYFETSSLTGTGHIELMKKLISEKESWPKDRATEVSNIGSNGGSGRKKGSFFQCCGF